MTQSVLAKLSRMQTELAEMRSVPKLKDLRDQAETLRAYTKQQGYQHDVQNLCAEVKIRTERRLGDVLGEMKTQKQRHAGHGDQKSKCHDVTPKLTDLGLTRKQSSRWQRMAGVPEKTFEKHLETVKATVDAELTSSGVLVLARAKRNNKHTKPQPEDTCTVKDLHTLVKTGRHFGTIYADPPWAYGNQATRAATGNHYETVSVDWLCNPKKMPIQALGADEAHLHLWTTNAFLFDARRVLEAWGFEYKSCFVWVKPKLGIGNYWRVSHEFLLLGVRGGLTFLNRSQRSWAELPRGRHSAKPEAVRQKIEAVSPLPRLELFARKVSDGWCCWGNEVARDLLTLSVDEI